MSEMMPQRLDPITLMKFMDEQDQGDYLRSSTHSSVDAEEELQNYLRTMKRFAEDTHQQDRKQHAPLIEEEEKQADPVPGMNAAGNAAGSAAGTNSASAQSDDDGGGQMLRDIMGMDPGGRAARDEDDDDGGDAITRPQQRDDASEETPLDPRYVKEAKRNWFSRMFVPTALTQKPERNFGDKTKGFFSGLGEFGLWALGGGLIGGISAGVKKVQKNYARKKMASYDRRYKATSIDNMEERNRLENKKYVWEQAAARHKAEQLQYGSVGSGYEWRKRLGRKWLTPAEQRRNDELNGGIGGLEDASWRDARDTALAVESGRGGRFDRNKMKMTKDVLALRRQRDRLQSRAARNPGASEAVQQQLAVLQEKEVAAQKNLSRATTQLDNRLSKAVDPKANKRKTMGMSTNVAAMVAGMNFGDEKFGTGRQNPAAKEEAKQNFLHANEEIKEVDEDEEDNQSENDFINDAYNQQYVDAYNGKDKEAQDDDDI